MKCWVKKIFLLFSEFQLGSFYYTYATPRPNVGSCPRLTDNDTFLGNYVTFSNLGLFPSLFTRSDGFQPSLRITRSKLLCESTGIRRDTASSVAFVVEYFDIIAPSTIRLATVIVDCALDPHGPTSHSFYPTPSPTATGLALNTAINIQGLTTLIDNEALFTSNFNTVAMFQCGQCEPTTSGIFTNQETRCTCGFNKH